MYYGVTFYVGEMLILVYTWEVSFIFLMTAVRLASQLEIIRMTQEMDEQLKDLISDKS